MFLKKHYQSGSAMVMALVVFAIIGAASAYIMDMMRENEKALLRDRRIQSYRALVQSVKTQLYTSPNCAGLILKDPRAGTPNVRVYAAQTNYFFHNGEQFERGGIPIALNLDFNKKKGPMVPKQGTNVWEIPGGTSIKEIKLKYRGEILRTDVQRDSPTFPRPPRQTAAYVYITIYPNHGGLNLQMPRNKDLEIKLLVYMNSLTGAINSCFAPEGDAAFCTMAGGAFNPTATNTLLSCEPDTACFTSDLGIFPQSRISECVSPYVAEHIGTTGSQKLYICNWCNRHRP